MNVLIIRPGALGDTLMVLPALADLAGKASVTFVGRRPGLDYVRGFVHFSMDFEGSGWHRLFMERPDDQGLPVARTDRLIAFFSEERPRLHQILGSYFPRTPIHVFRSHPNRGQDIHSAFYISNCLKAAGLPVDPKRSMECATGRALLGDSEGSERRSRLVLHPGSGDLKKNHPPDFWLTLRGRLDQEVGFQELDPVFLLGPAEAGLYHFFRKKVASMNAEICYCPDKDPLIGLLRGAALYIGHDSGITHLSAMLGIPTIALFKESEPCQWRPLGPYARVISNRDRDPELIEKVMALSGVFLRTEGKANGSWLKG